MKRETLKQLAFGILSTLTAVSNSSAATFEGLGQLPGGNSSGAAGISSNGEFIAGVFRDSDRKNHAVVWSQDSELRVINNLPNGNYTFGRNVANDGTVVGNGDYFTDRLSIGAFRSFGTGAGLLQDLPGGAPVGYAEAIDDLGTKVVGESSGTDAQQAVIWPLEGGVQPLGVLPGHASSRAFGISPDGTVVVGDSNPKDGPRQAFRYIDSETGLEPLVNLSNLNPFSIALDASLDGEVIVGSSGTSTSLQEAVYWTSDRQPHHIGLLPGDNESMAIAVTHNGSTILGASFDTLQSGNDPKSFIWQKHTGMRTLEQILREANVDFTGWRHLTASDLSADGSILVGSGANPQGFFEAWRADIGDLLRLEGDANDDGVVDSEDLNIVALNWQIMVTGGPGDGDFNDDGKVDAADLNEVALNWLAGVGDNSLLTTDPFHAPSSNQITTPEPITGGVIVMMMSATVLRRRRRHN